MEISELRTTGEKGPGDERIEESKSVAFTVLSGVVIIRGDNDKMFLFTVNGHFLIVCDWADCSESHSSSLTAKNCYSPSVL